MQAHIERGLKSLGLYKETDSSLFHSFEGAFPVAAFDAHRSVLSVPDHMFFHVLTRKLISALFAIMSPILRAAVEISLRDGLPASNLRRTRAWNFKTERVNTRTII